MYVTYSNWQYRDDDRQSWSVEVFTNVEGPMDSSSHPCNASDWMVPGTVPGDDE